MRIKICDICGKIIHSMYFNFYIDYARCEPVDGHSLEDSSVSLTVCEDCWKKHIDEFVIKVHRFEDKVTFSALKEEYRDVSLFDFSGGEK